MSTTPLTSSAIKGRLCVVISMHNEAENLDVLVERLRRVIDQLDGWEVQLLFVDDESTDDSVLKLQQMRERGLPVAYLRLSRRFGHQAAIAAGLMAAGGEAVIIMDADLQHPPEVIPDMVEAFVKGADVVQMIRSVPRRGSKGLFSRVFYRFFNAISDTPIVPDAPDFRLLSRRVVDVVNQIPEREKFHRGLIPSLGFTQVVLGYDEADRLAGSPTYSLRSSLRLAWKALFDYSTIPLRLVFWAGTTIAMLSFTFGVGFVIVKLIWWHSAVPGFTDLIFSILFMSGCILMSIGILGRYLIMILEQVRGRPAFTVMEHVEGGPLPPLGEHAPPPVSH